MVPQTRRIGLLFGVTLGLLPAQWFLQSVMAQNHWQGGSSPYATMRNSDLKKEAKRLAFEMRQYAAQARAEELTALTGQANSTGQNPFRHLLRYDRELKPQAAGLRDEILSRLPRNERPQIKYSTIDFAVSVGMLEEAADTLEKLAKLLPAMRFRDRPEVLPLPPNEPLPALKHT